MSRWQYPADTSSGYGYYRGHGRPKRKVRIYKTEYREGRILSLDEIRESQPRYDIEWGRSTKNYYRFRHPCGRTLEVSIEDVEKYFGNGKVYKFKLDSRKDVGSPDEREIWEIQLYYGEFGVYGDFIISNTMIDDLIGEELFEI